MARQYQLQKKESGGGSGIDYQAELNAEQYEAVSAAPGPVLVIAGAGSGKTRTLTYRVAFLLDQGVEPRNLLLLTFTNKAAREMMERVRDLVSRDLSELWSGTFHSIGSRILRRHPEEVGLTRSFSIMDRDDQKSLMKTVVAGCKIDESRGRFPKVDVLITIFSLVENTGVTVEEILETQYSHLEEWNDEIAAVRKAYRAKKGEINSVDFDDLLTLPLELFKKNPEILALYQKRFHYLLVDEYQDTNTVQSELISLLAEPQNSVMVVGDDAQSIYSWRGANMDHILSFPKRYAHARVIKIETNYRSVPEVLEISNQAISANVKQFQKNLRAARESAGMLPALVALDDPRSQAEFVAQRITELHNEGVELNEMAILYRAHHLSLEVQMELTMRGIPFEITSGLRFFEQAHVKDVAAFLRFVTNRRDEVSFKRFCQLLPGVGEATADRLWSEWLKSGKSHEAEPPASFSEVMLRFKVPPKGKKEWEQLCYTLDELAPGGRFARPADMITSVLLGVYDAYMKASFDNYDHRKQDLQQLSGYAEGFEEIEELLEQLSLMSSIDGDPAKQKEDDDQEKVTLSSIHQAKGLEWKVVFVIWLADKMFPNGRVLESESLDQFEEERRLFYVALTRAKDQLYLTYPQMNPRSYTGDDQVWPSRFLDDCGEDNVEIWEVGPGW